MRRGRRSSPTCRRRARPTSTACGARRRKVPAIVTKRLHKSRRGWARVAVPSPEEKPMSSDTFLAVFLGSEDSQAYQDWTAMPEAERKAKEMEGVVAWKAWAQKHQGAIVQMGGPLGKTKRVTKGGV